MDSVLDSAIAPPGADDRPPGWRERMAQALAWLGWTDLPALRGRRRRMQIDRLRLAATLAGVVGVAVALAVAWTWQARQAAAHQSASIARDAIDGRLDAMAHDLRRIAALPDLQSPLTGCSTDLVQALLDESLHSLRLRRFEVVERDSPLRCGPRGERVAEVVAVPLEPGLTLMTGGKIAVQPELMLGLGNGRAVMARLDDSVLRLSGDTWPDDLDLAGLRILLRMADGGTQRLWGGARDASSVRGPIMQAQVSSALHQVTVTTEVSGPALAARPRPHGGRPGLLSALAVLLAVSWVWRRAVLQTRMVHRLRHALRKRQFEPFVQPIVDLRTGRCIGGEVLMRWNHPFRGILGPGEFIDEAERTGLIIGMSDLTMSLAAHRLAPLAQADRDLYFSFNVTPGQLREPGFGQRLAEIFRPDTLPRQQVLLELTERDFVDARTKRMLVALRAEGWRMAIDDFGTGQSSLATIEHLPIDRIKIDRAFVSAIDDDTVSRPVLDAIIHLAAELRIPLIAEGVETRSQWDYLAQRGVDSAQGYLMARPMSISDYLSWLEGPVSQSGAAGSASSLASGATRPGPSPLSGAQHQLWQRMAGPGGLQVEDRSHQLRLYPRCFVGREAVDWLVSHQGINRQQAVRLGQGLVAVGLIRHVLDEHDFKDGDFFYRLAAEAAGPEPEAGPEALAGMKALQESVDFPWRSHSRGLLRHHLCASGRTIVDWIIQRYALPRPVAVRWATLWMRKGALRHILDAQPFLDNDRSLYRLG